MKNMLKSLYLNIASDFAINHLSDLLTNYKDVLYNNQKILGPVIPESDINLEYLTISPIIKEICILAYSYITNTLNKIDIINSIANIEKENIKNNIIFKNLDLDDNILVKMIYNIVKLSVPFYGITDTLDSDEEKFYTYTISESLLKELENYIALRIIPYCKKKKLNFEFDYEFFNNPVVSSITRAHTYHDSTYHTDYLRDFNYTLRTLECTYDIIRFINSTNNEYIESMNNIIETEPILTIILRKIMELESIDFYSKDSGDLQYLIYIDVKYSDTVPRTNLNEPNSIVLDISTVVHDEMETICSIGVYKKDSDFIITSAFVLDDERLHVEKTKWTIMEYDFKTPKYFSILDTVVEFFEYRWTKYWYDKIVDKYNSIDEAKQYISDLFYMNKEYDEYDDNEINNCEEPILLIDKKPEQEELRPTEIFDKYFEEGKSNGMSIDEALKYAVDKCNTEYKDLN